LQCAGKRRLRWLRRLCRCASFGSSGAEKQPFVEGQWKMEWQWKAGDTSCLAQTSRPTES
jgi:hypothetical protein